MSIFINEDKVAAFVKKVRKRKASFQKRNRFFGLVKKFFIWSSFLTLFLISLTLTFFFTEGEGTVEILISLIYFLILCVLVITIASLLKRKKSTRVHRARVKKQHLSKAGNEDEINNVIKTFEKVGIKVEIWKEWNYFFETMELLYCKRSGDEKKSGVYCTPFFDYIGSF